MDAVVVHVDHGLALHLLHEALDEVSEVLRVVRPVDDLVVDETLLLTDGTYDCDVLASIGLHVDGQISTHPSLGWDLPTMKRGFIHVDDLLAL